MTRDPAHYLALASVSTPTMMGLILTGLKAPMSLVGLVLFIALPAVGLAAGLLALTQLRRTQAPHGPIRRLAIVGLAVNSAILACFASNIIWPPRALDAQVQSRELESARAAAAPSTDSRG